MSFETFKRKHPDLYRQAYGIGYGKGLESGKECGMHMAGVSFSKILKLRKERKEKARG